MPEQYARYLSVNKAQWNHIGHMAAKAIHDKAKANENCPSRDLARRVINMGSVSQRAQVLAQILSPSGRIHVHHTGLRHQVSCFPQSACWRFVEADQ